MNKWDAGTGIALVDPNARTGSRQKELGQYPTRVWVAEALVERHFPELGCNDFVIEPGCGPGAFLGAVPRNVPALGIDIDPVMADEARRNTGREVLVGDFRSMPLSVSPTVILGNPVFKLKVIDGFLDRSYGLLPEGGRVGFILPAYALQTASRVAAYADRWSMFQEMIPRNIFRGLSLPLVFALFSKDRRRVMVGFALYREAADIERLAPAYRKILDAGVGSVWRRVVEMALERLGGEADLQSLYAEIGRNRPTRTEHWKAQVRKVVRTSPAHIVSTGRGRYARRLADNQMAA